MTVTVFANATGCVVTRSNITGDVLCRWPGEECDCLVSRVDESYANHPVLKHLERPQGEPPMTITSATVDWEIERLASDADPTWLEQVEHAKGPGKFERAANLRRCIALYTIANHGLARMDASFEDGSSASLIGRWILRTDSQGFVFEDEFDTDEDAERRFLAEFCNEENE